MSLPPPAPILSGNGLLLPEALGEILVRTVRQNGDDHARLEIPRNLERRRHRGPSREARQDTLLLSKALDHVVGFLGRGAKVLIGDGRVVDLRYDRTRHVLHAL